MEGGIDANCLCARQRPEPFEECLPVWPAGVRTAIGLLQIEEERQLTQVALEQVDP
jgi:hypothetical protein